MKLPPSVEVRNSGVKFPFPYNFIVGTGTFVFGKTQDHGKSQNE
jgi:hypothetical protein